MGAGEEEEWKAEGRAERVAGRVAELLSAPLGRIWHQGMCQCSGWHHADAPSASLSALGSPTQFPSPRSMVKQR